MSESNLWVRFRDRTKEVLRLQRLENAVGAGVPDVFYAFRDGAGSGFVELKHAKDYPKRQTTQVFGRGGLRAEQIQWCYSFATSGVVVWILAQVGDDVFLVHGSKAREFNSFTEEDLREESEVWYRRRLDWEELLAHMRGVHIC